MARTLSYTPNSAWFEPAATSDVWESHCERRLGEERRILKHGVRRNGPVNTLAALRGTSLRGTSDGTLNFFQNEEQQDEETIVPQTSIPDDGQSVKPNVASLEECLAMNAFSRRADRDDWDRLCQDMPLTATYAERMGEMAKEECDRKGNPFGATPQWIEHMKMTNELVTFECFHLPDRMGT
jgi:hypothetical protein